MSKVSLEPTIERELVEKAQQDPDQFAPLFEHYYPHIRRFFSVKLTSADLIEDLTSITFEKAFKNINKFSWQGFSFSSWLYRIASNTLTDYYRQDKSGKRVQIDDLQIASDAKGPEEELEEESTQKVIQDLLKSLPERERSIIYMKFFDGFTNKAIADKSGLSPTNVGTIVHRALAKMQELLSNQK
jgi:RNA polymerase sigma-70 factor (ECF subfamily)